MSSDEFELALEREPGVAVRDVARAELERARELVARLPTNTEEATHEFRKSIKRLRALVRLVRGPLKSEFRSCNHGLRNAGRAFSNLRDEHVLREALQGLRTRDLGQPERLALDRALHLWHGQERQEEDAELRERTALALGQLAFAEKSLARLTIESYDDMGAGLRRAYRSARKHYRALAHGRDDFILHELRKRIKDVRLHLDLLARSAPDILEAKSKLADEIGELLGRDHDLVVLHAKLAALGIDPNEQLVIERLIEAERARLQDRALGRSQEFLREKARARTARILGYVRTFRSGVVTP